MVETSHSDVIATEDPAAKLAGLRYKFSDFEGVEVGPLPHLAGERSRLNKLKWKNFDASMIGSTVGAEIDGIDLTVGISSNALEELHQALVEYKVIFLRNQQITSSQQVAFAESFGELEIHPFIPSNT
ncbi:MAG: TauD/TfdA family dioxygenase, partial [Acidimicrobiales bacterium]|nr:TauD/TfdA family dioxygenase [Acidimicrobiales bacterium]